MKSLASDLRLAKEYLPREFWFADLLYCHDWSQCLELNPPSKNAYCISSPSCWSYLSVWIANSFHRRLLFGYKRVTITKKDTKFVWTNKFVLCVRLYRFFSFTIRKEDISDNVRKPYHSKRQSNSLLPLLETIQRRICSVVVPDLVSWLLFRTAIT